MLNSGKCLLNPSLQLVADTYLGQKGLGLKEHYWLTVNVGRGFAIVWMRFCGINRTTLKRQIWPRLAKSMCAVVFCVEAHSVEANMWLSVSRLKQASA
jgi:hypothetical protein